MTIKYVDKFELDNEEILIKDSALTERVDSLDKKYYIFIGDSYVDSSDVENSIMTYLPNYMGLNNNYLTKALSGAGFTVANKLFLTLLQNAYAEISNPSIITDIVVLGGYNDRAVDDYNTVLNAIETFINYAKNNFPKAKVTISFLGNTIVNTYSVRNSLRKAMMAYQDCGKFGAKYIVNSEFINHVYTYFRDDIHPNSNGAKNMAIKLSNGIINGSCDCSYEAVANVLLPIDGGNPGNWTSATGVIREYMNNGVLEMASDSSITFERDESDASSISGTVKLGEFEEGIMRPTTYIGRTICIGRAYVVGTGWQDFTGLIRFNSSVRTSGGIIELVLGRSIPNVSTIQIYPINMTINSLYA